MIGGEDKMKLMKGDKQGYYGTTKLKWLTVWELKLQHFATTEKAEVQLHSFTIQPYSTMIYHLS